MLCYGADKEKQNMFFIADRSNAYLAPEAGRWWVFGMSSEAHKRNSDLQKDRVSMIPSVRKYTKVMSYGKRATRERKAMILLSLYDYAQCFQASFWLLALALMLSLASCPDSLRETLGSEHSNMSDSMGHNHSH